jgi:transposase
MHPTDDLSSYIEVPENGNLGNLPARPAGLGNLMEWSAAFAQLAAGGIRGVRRRNAMELFTLGIDLGKTTFHIVGMNQRGEVVVRKCFSRAQLLHFTANLKVELIGMEACGGSHFLGRALREQGHDVRLIPAQYVKPYVKTNKSDYIDAEAIAEAVGRPRMRFVPIKSDDQLDLQSLHRVRERWVMRRTAVVNQIRGLLLERGITLRKGRRYVDAALPGILVNGTAKLSGAVLVLLTALKLELEQLAEKIDGSDTSIAQIARENEACQRLVAMPGVGPVTATAIIATIGNGAAFRKGRDFAAWLGVIPEEHSTGGKQTLWKIPQRGNQYLRRLFVQGARAVMQHRTKQSSGLSAWLAQLTARTHQNIAIVALANKLARMAWAVLAKNEAYRPPLVAGAATM